jgi:hypothetical protein
MPGYWCEVHHVEDRATTLRALDKAIGDHLGRVQVGEGVAKSAQHQGAVRARWDRRDAERAAARAAGGAVS